MKEKEINVDELKKEQKQQPNNSKRLVWLALILLVAATSVGNLFRSVSRTVRHDINIVLDEEFGAEIEAIMEDVERELEQAMQEVEAELEAVEQELEAAEHELEETEQAIEEALR